jgi:cytoskeletal protein CcmA (bactofilin family)
VVGLLYIEGDLRVGGTVEGELEATGDVDIDDEAKVKASVAGRQVSIRGHVNGAVTARKRLVVGRTGSLIGDVHVARLVIQEGATFSGNVSMGSPAEAPPRAPEIHLPAAAPETIEPPAAEPPVVVVSPPAAEEPPVTVQAPTPSPPAAAKADGRAKAVPAQAQKTKPTSKVKPKPKRR